MDPGLLCCGWVRWVAGSYHVLWLGPRGGRPHWLLLTHIDGWPRATCILVEEREWLGQGRGRPRRRTNLDRVVGSLGVTVVVTLVSVAGRKWYVFLLLVQELISADELPLGTHAPPIFFFHVLDVLCCILKVRVGSLKVCNKYIFTLRVDFDCYFASCKPVHRSLSISTSGILPHSPQSLRPGGCGGGD